MSETTEAEGTAEPAAPAPAAASVPEVLPKWMDERLAAMRRKLGDEERARQLAESRLAELERNANPGTQPAASAVPTQAQLEARAMELAQRMNFTEACNNIARQGNAKFEDFGDVVANFGKYLGDIPPALVEGALETDDPAATIYALGKDMAEATRIAGLSPTRQAAAVVRYAAKLAKPEAPAAAAATPAASARTPAPIVPKVGTSAGTRNTPIRLDDDNISVDEWMKARRESLKR